MGALSRISVFFVLLCLGCSKDEPAVQFEVNVPLEVQPYIDRFVAEAAERNQIIDLSAIGLDIVFEQDLDNNLAAFCNEGTIAISKQDWDARSDTRKEEMIFHELGHCILNRQHHNPILANDEWQSIMRGLPLPAGRAACINYSGTRREYYIDELFNPNTPEPDWVHIREDYALTAGARDTFLYRTDLGSFTNRMNLPDSGDFEIEVLIDIQMSTTSVGIAWGGDQLQDENVVHYTPAKTFTINAGLSDQSIIYQRDVFPALDDTINLITIRKRSDKYYIFVNEKFIYWMDVKTPFVNRFRVLSNYIGPPNFKEVVVYRLIP